VFFILAAFTASAMARPIMTEAWTDDPPTTIKLQDDQRDHGSPQPVVRGGQAVSETEQQVVDSIALVFELAAEEPGLDLAVK